MEGGAIDGDGGFGDGKASPPPPPAAALSSLSTLGEVRGESVEEVEDEEEEERLSREEIGEKADFSRSRNNWAWCASKAG